MRTTITILLAAGLLGACIARGPEDYRIVTRDLVDTRKGDIESCFAGEKGKVVIAFTVEKKSGKITNPTVDTAKSSAGEGVGECIAKAIDGLAIEQPDMRDGAATFTWSFES